MEHVRSQDGTLIALERRGTGPPLLLVHGVLGSSRRWPMLPALDQHFTLYIMDRRGRGRSGDTLPYTIEREFEDVAAVVNAIGSGVNLFGHSFGGLCVLEAARLSPHVRRLIAYEPAPVPAARQITARLQALLDAGERETAIATFLQEIVEMPAHEIELLRASPAFPAMLDAAHTIPRELRAEEAYRLESARFRHLRRPILLLAGGDSPPASRAVLEAWHAALPDSQVAVLPGQQHIAHYTAPELLARQIVSFLFEQ